MAYSQSVKIEKYDSITNLTPYIRYLEDPKASYSIEDILKLQSEQRFSSLSEENEFSKIQWLNFTLSNVSDENLEFKINFTFTDWVDFYVYDEKDSLIKHIQSGDLYAIPDREVVSGIMVFNRLYIPAQATRKIFVRLASTTGISHQFKNFTLESINLYSDAAFNKRFIKEKLYQALFYGALFIMLFYNFFIYITLRNKSYLYYIIFLSFLILFLSANSGYLAEIILPTSPRLDLYIRFLSPAFVVFFYLVFSQSFLKVQNKNLRLKKGISFIMGGLIFIVIMMIFGYWKLGRTMIIVTAIISFLLILIVAIKNITRGFTPARYFLAANALFLLGGAFYALERFSVAVQNPVTQHATQIAVALEIALLSIGLADRINVTRKELSKSIIENEKLETKRIEERRRLISDKNKALQKSYAELDTFIYKTAHDIKGPLARLLGLSNVALMEVEDLKSREYFQRFYDDSNKLNLILSRLSTVHEISNAAVSNEAVHVEAIILEIINKHKKRLEKIKILPDLDHNLIINTDPVLLKFILNDLLDNAIKFQKEDEKEPFIQMKTLKTGKYLVFNIIDNGIGIKHGDKATLFEMFTRAAGVHGTIGLGLYMVNLAAKKLGGGVTLINNSSRLTQFRVKIPMNFTGK